MYFLLKMGIFHCYVSLSEGTRLGDVAGWHKLWVDRTYGKPIIEARRVGNGISSQEILGPILYP